MRPTDRPTNATRTNARMMGLPVMTFAKSVIHSIDADTISPTLDMISVMVMAVTSVWVNTSFHAGFYPLLFYVDETFEKTHDTHCKGSAYEIYHRLGHQKVGQLVEKPHCKYSHLFHTATPSLNRQNTNSARTPAEHNHT